MGTKAENEQVSPEESKSQASKTVVGGQSEEEKSDSEEGGNGMSEPKVGKRDKSGGVSPSDEGSPKSARSQNTS